MEKTWLQELMSLKREFELCLKGDQIYFGRVGGGGSRRTDVCKGARVIQACVMNNILIPRWFLEK